MQKKQIIGVTGVGGGVGQSIVKSLYNTDYGIIGMDGEVLAAGIYALPKSFIVPYANQDDYIPKLISICKSENIKLLFPGMDAELPKLSKSAHEFSKIGTTVVVSRPEIIEIADNKLMTSDFLRTINLPSPRTVNLFDYYNNNSIIDLPIIIKPKVGGFRSKHVFKVAQKQDLLTVKQIIGDAIENYVAQEYIEGDEYTCGSVTLNNTCYGVIVMRRILRDGDTYKCFSVKDKKIEEIVYKIVDNLKPFGALNVQLRVKNGIPYVFELNARCSGTTAARSLAGFNEPKMIADYLLQNKLPEYNIREVTILRYWKELLVENNQVAAVKENLKSDNQVYNNL